MEIKKTIFILMSPLLLGTCGLCTATPDGELVYSLKASVVKVHATTRQGGRAVGTGVVVAPDVVATNCHILSQAEDVHISKMGDSVSPVSMQADQEHDVCLLKFQYLNLPTVTMRRAGSLHYQEEIFSIGFPGGVRKPQTTAGKIRALYPYEDSVIVRSDAAFIMGASGSPVFDSTGHLLALSTFKSPGKNAFYYSVPVEWIQNLLEKQEITLNQGQAFWDTSPELRPAFMRVVEPYMQADWAALQTISADWVARQPQSAEAYFYLASALHGQGQLTAAQTAYMRCLQLEAGHSEALQGLAILAQQTQQDALFNTTSVQLKQLDMGAWQGLQARLEALR